MNLQFVHLPFGHLSDHLVISIFTKSGAKVQLFFDICKRKRENFKNYELRIKNYELPTGDGVVIDVFRNLGNHHGAEFVLHIRQEAAGVESLVSRVGLVKGLLGVDVIGETYGDPDGQFALGSIAVGRDSPLRDVITDNLALQLQVTALAENLEPCLALVDVTDALGEVVAEGWVDHRRVVREVGDRDGVGGLVVDVGTVELVADGATAQDEQQTGAQRLTDRYADRPFH